MPTAFLEIASSDTRRANHLGATMRCESRVSTWQDGCERRISYCRDNPERTVPDRIVTYRNTPPNAPCTNHAPKRTVEERPFRAASRVEKQRALAPVVGAASPLPQAL